jgi:hypothetical protein
MNTHEFEHMPTDMMCRRTQLDLCGQFLFFGTTVTINTNYVSILGAAEEAGFAPLRDTGLEPGVRWEIVGTLSGAAQISDWECRKVLDDHAIYLSMGPEQWFAFDLETHEGAGFAVVSDLHRSVDHAAGLYLLSVAYNVGACLRTELGKNHRHG